MDYTPPGSSIHGIFQARILEWVAISYDGIFPTQGLKPPLLHFLQRQADSLPLVPSGKPLENGPFEMRPIKILKRSLMLQS